MSDGAQKRVALVTGASRGIGRAILEALLNGGQCSAAVGTATTPEGAAGITQRISELGGKGEGFSLDLKDREGIAPALERIEEQFGGIDILVNNAGIAKDALLLRMRDEDLDEVLAVNLQAAMLVSKKALRGMLKRRWGRIVNVSSVVASTGNAGQALYAATKAGIEGFTRSLSQEAGSKGITVNCVAPGFIDTDMTRDGIGEEAKAALVEMIPAGRIGRPEEIGACVAFLCSEEASYVTGHTLHANGGLYVG